MSDEFDFEAGDTVLVRLRERGQLRAKFVATVDGFESRHPMLSDRVRLDPPWDSLTGMTLGQHDAEFEVVESVEEVNF